LRSSLIDACLLFLFFFLFLDCNLNSSLEVTLSLFRRDKCYLNLTFFLGSFLFRIKKKKKSLGNRMTVSSYIKIKVAWSFSTKLLFKIIEIQIN
jgi:hypothetical protein